VVFFNKVIEKLLQQIALMVLILTPINTPRHS